MFAGAVLAVLFVTVGAITWLSSRADASHARCDELARHIRHALEVAPPNRSAPPRRPRH